ncbi:MAG TPA: TadE family protein [Myxococcales bacterium]|nr:TadE family protein [Myxococcales bacterium]
MTDALDRVGVAKSRSMGGESGQAVLEAAIVLPLCLALILCAIQLAQLQQARVLLEYAAFNAARAGIVHDGENDARGTAGPMHDAAALSLLPSFGRTDGFAAVTRTWAQFRAREAMLTATRLPLLQVSVLNPRRADFARLGEHLDGQEIDFDDVRPQAADANLLSIDVRYLYELRVPFANQLIQGAWLLRPASATADDRAALALLGRQGRYFVPVHAFYTMRMQSNPFLRWAAP